MIDKHDQGTVPGHAPGHVLGEVVNEYQSINDICEELNIVRPDNIRNVLRGKQKTAYGYIWKYKKDYEEACENMETKEEDKD